MAGYRDLARMIQKGVRPAEIIERMNVRPSRLKEMMNGRRLRDLLEIERQLAAAIAYHARARGVREMHRRLVDLADSPADETARKAVTTLFADALACEDRESELPPRDDLPPWMYLRPLNDPSRNQAPPERPWWKGGRAGGKKKRRKTAARASK